MTELTGSHRGESRRPLADQATRAALRLTSAAAQSDWRGPDPFDGLWWNWPRPAVAGKRRRQAVMQIHVRSPLDIRRLYRRSHPLIPKALGIFASASARLWRLTGEERCRELAVAALAALEGDHSAGESAWGYWWDMQTRWSFYPAGSPNVVVTAFAAHGFQDCAVSFGLGDYGIRARNAARWVREVLWLSDRQIFIYHPGSAVLIHNANLLGAALVRRLLPDDPSPDAALSPTLAAQAADGSWSYGSGAGNLRFVDSFHTGYVLSCLVPFAHREDVSAALERGAEYYTTRFFDRDGRALLWPNRHYPEDAHSAGTALSTLALLCRLGLAKRELLERVTRRTLTHVVRGDHAVHRRGRRWRSTVHYLRWCDAHVALGLSAAAEVLGRPA